MILVIGKHLLTKALDHDEILTVNRKYHWIQNRTKSIMTYEAPLVSCVLNCPRDAGKELFSWKGWKKSWYLSRVFYTE
jgi:hypothetical protein